MAFPHFIQVSVQIPPPSLTVLAEECNTHPRGLQNPHPAVFFSRCLTTAWQPSTQKDEWVDTDMSRHIGIVVVQSPGRVQPLATPWTAACQASLSFIIFWSLPKFMSIIGDAIQPSHPLIALFFCPQSFPASGTFPMSHLFTSDDQNTGFWASVSVLPMSIQGWFPLRLTGLISLLSKGLSGVFSSTTVQRHRFFGALPSLRPNSQLYVTTGKPTALTIWTFVGREMSLLFKTLSGFVIDFLPRSNCLLISWLQSPSAVILEPKKRKSVITSTFSPSICYEVMGLDAMILVFLKFSFKLALSLSSLSARNSLVPLFFLLLEWYQPHIWGSWHFSQ